MAIDLEPVGLVPTSCVPGDEVPVLVGAKNWGKWDYMMKTFVVGVSEKYWDLITGVWQEPKLLSVADAQALIPEYQKEVDLLIQDFEFAAMLARLGNTTRETATGDMQSSILKDIVVTVDTVQRNRMRERNRWHLINNQCQYWIIRKLGHSMLGYCHDLTLAAEVYAKLKKTCESIHQQSKANALHSMVRWTYRGTKPIESVQKWKQKQQEYEDQIKPSQYLNASTISNMFLGAIGDAPGITPWLNTYNMDPKRSHEENLEDLYDSFVAAETHRLSSSSKLQAAANGGGDDLPAGKTNSGVKSGDSSKPNQKDRSHKPLCSHCKHHGHSWEDCYHNPINKDKPRKPGKGYKGKKPSNSDPDLKRQPNSPIFKAPDDNDDIMLAANGSTLIWID